MCIALGDCIEFFLVLRRECRSRSIRALGLLAHRAPLVLEMCWRAMALEFERLVLMHFAPVAETVTADRPASHIEKQNQH
jgi:hypothetical protein